MAWLLNTNVLSELRRPRPEQKIVDFVSGFALDDLYISMVTLAEIRFGIELAAEPVRRAELNEWLTHRVRPMFFQRVLPLNEDIMLKWRLLVEDGRKKGHTFSQPDLIIAATALHYGFTVVTCAEYVADSIGSIAACQLSSPQASPDPHLSRHVPHPICARTLLQT